jgi:arabinan endo-1,5-alpha-L-arabinosidase
VDGDRTRVSRLVRRLLSGATALVVAVSLAGCSAGNPRLTVSGDLAAHDPDIVAGQNGSPWYVYSTGDESIGDGNIEIRSSTDGHDWKLVGTVWKKKPAWLTKTVKGVSNLWAPELFHHGSTWYLYYAASTFGSNKSVIALATNTTLDPNSSSYKWVDRGVVIASHSSDNYNAIDPTIIDGPTGQGWMAFGSFWGGIQLVKIAWPSGKLANSDPPKQIAYRGSPPDAIEAATILRHGGYYYLIVSLDSCCQGSASTYNMGMGRSKNVAGPYVGKSGHPLLDDGTSPLLATVGHEVGPGGESYSNGYLAWHFYDANVGGATTLAIQKLGWTKDGWPTLAQN